MDTDKKGGRPNWLRTRTLHKVAYTVVAGLAVASYATVRSFVIAQEPVDTHITVSNLTLTLVLFAIGLGAVSPLVARRLFPRRYKLMMIPVQLVMGICFVLLLKALGVEMRF